MPCFFEAWQWRKGVQDLRGSGAGESESMREQRKFPTRSDVSRISLRQRLLSDA